MTTEPGEPPNAKRFKCDPHWRLTTLKCSENDPKFTSDNKRLSEDKMDPEMTGTELEIITPGAHAILGAEVDRAPALRTTAGSDEEMLAVWLKSHQDGSAHTLRVYTRVGRRFIEALAARNTDLRHATVEDVQEALQTMRTKADGTPVRPATVNTYVATVKSFLNFAHTIGYTRFNAAPLIKLKKAPRHLAKRILSEVDIHVLIRAAKTWPRPPVADGGILRGTAGVGTGCSDLGECDPTRQWRSAVGRHRQGLKGPPGSVAGRD